MKPTLLMMLTLITLFPLRASSGTVPASTPELIAKGKQVYTNNCVVCHGALGLGDGVAASGLNPKPRNLVSDPFKAGTKKEQVFATVSNGLKGTGMAGFSTLGESDRWAVVMFVLSLRK